MSIELRPPLSRERPSSRRLGRSSQPCRLLAAFALSSLTLICPAGSIAQDDEPAPQANWRRIGSFSGAPVEGAGEFFDNELFREARSGDLFQELGDLDISFGQTWSATSVDAAITYSRRVLDKHLELAPGSTVGDGDLSWFQTVNSARAKTSLDVDYLPDSNATIGVGLHAESGFVMTAAETQAPRKLGAEFSRTASRENLRAELAGYWDKKDARFRKKILPRLGRTLLGLLDALASEINLGFEDTEKGALYFEGFVEPMTLWVDLGFPLKTDLFTSADPRLQPGDGATYTAFVGISPLRFSAHELGLRASYEYFYRLIRETTVIEQADDHVLVRVRTIAAKGQEITPIKIRPEVRLAFLRYGYTFLQDRRDSSRFRVADLVYRFDLGVPEGRAALDDLLGAKNRVRLKSPIEAAREGRGVEVLSAELRTGDRRDLNLLARFPSWFRTKRQNLAVVQDIKIGTATVREATQGQRRSVKVRNLGLRRDQGSSSVLTLQATPIAGSAGAKARAIEVRTAMSDRRAGVEPRRQVASLWRTLPGNPEPPPELFGTEAVGVVASFTAGARGQALDRLLSMHSEEIWRTVGHAVLGADQADSWRTAEGRALWKVQHDRKDRRRLASAERFVAWFDDLRYRTIRGDIDGRGWTRNALHREDFPILERLILAAGGSAPDGTANGGSVSAEIWTDEMPRPLRLIRGRSPISRLGALAAEPEAAPVGTLPGPSPVGTNGSPERLEGSTVETAAQARDIDSLRSSAPRLLAGRMFVVEPSPQVPVIQIPTQYYLSLFSDLHFAPSHRVRIELRRSRIRADLPLAVVGMPAGQAQPVPEGPFAIAKFRYDLRLPQSLASRIDDRHPYSVYVRVLNAQGLPLTEEEPLHFRVPRKKVSKPKGSGEKTKASR
ncbi:MAG TPA: hypothetical protein VN851_20820 [Thermoanaerobaculia bacterium]|nr:hypothetical protein [Thermoanaerobaculia bacterium]